VLLARGLRIAVIKHAAHGFDIDRPGKDTYNIRRTGIEQTLIVGGADLALVERWRDEPSLQEVVRHYVRDGIDLVVTEGYKRERHPKIEVARKEISTELVSSDGELIAVVCDFVPRTSAPVFGTDDAGAVADVVVRRVLQR
jgi:molybdopterin-guanine dinucleotide biosynthesis protein B